MIVGQVEIRRSGRTRVDLKGQGIPAALICELEIGAHRQYGAGLGGSVNVGIPKKPPMSKLANAAPDRIQLSAPRRLAAMSAKVQPGSPPQCTGYRWAPA